MTTGEELKIVERGMKKKRKRRSLDESMNVAINNQKKRDMRIIVKV